MSSIEYRLSQAGTGGIFKGPPYMLDYRIQHAQKIISKVFIGSTTLLASDIGRPMKSLGEYTVSSVSSIGSRGLDRVKDCC